MCGGGGGGGQRPLEAEERNLLNMQSRVALQGIQGRERANLGYEGFVTRGRERGSVANQEAEAGRSLADATAAYGNAQRMRDTRMASMGVNPGDPRFARGRDAEGVGFAGQAAAGMNRARAGARAEGMQMEGAGLTGLAGNDPSAALSSMGNTIRSAGERQVVADRTSAEGWGQLGMGAMYGLKNAKSIGEGAREIAGWFADGGLVPDVQHFANGGNVYDRAMGDMSAMRSQMPARGPAAPEGGGAMVDPISATRVAKGLVDSAASAIAPTPSGTGFKMAADGLGFKAGAGAGEMMGVGTAAEGAGLGLTAGADAAAMLGAGAAEGTAAASALGAAGAALPWIGGGLMVGQALGLFADGGPVGIGRRASGGVAMNPRGGPVSGPGGPKDDKVPSMLSPGEFVLPVGAVRKYGLDRLEKMRQAGLEFEKERGIA